MPTTYNKTLETTGVKTNVIAILLLFHFIKVELCDQNCNGLLWHTKDAMIYQ